MTPVDFNNDDDGWQPMSLSEWITRSRASIAALRANAHRQVDELFDEQLRRTELEAACIERDMAEHSIN